MAGEWLPDEAIYLEKHDEPIARPSRPWNQGDIFWAPLVILDKPKKPANDGDPIDPKSGAKVKNQPVALLSHTCSVRGGATLATFQNVAWVRPAKENELTRFATKAQEGQSWNCDYKLFPLPGFRDDSLWVIDFNVLGTVKFSNLKDQRVAVLNEAGWAAFRKRYAWHSLRLQTDYNNLLRESHPTWIELDLWETWVERGFSEPAFQEVWLEQPLGGSSQYAGTKRRDLLKFGGAELRADLPVPGDADPVQSTEE